MGEFDNSVSSYNTKCCKTCYANVYVIISVMYNNILCRIKHDSCKMNKQHFIFYFFVKIMAMFYPFDLTPPFTVSGACCLCPEGPICSSCCYRRELPGWKLP